MNRRYRISKKFQAKEIAGTQMILYMFSDLDDGELAYQFYHYLERDDFEYLEQIVAEATLRGIKFKVNKNK